MILETGGGPGDLDIIGQIISHPSLRVAGIIVSEGVLPARETYQQVQKLLKQTYHEGILTGVATGARAGSFHAPTARQVAEQVFKYSPEKITWVCLDKSCSGYQSMITIPGYKDHLAKVIRGDDPERKAIFALLNVPEKEETKVLDSLPETPAFYREDIRPIVTESIRRYGTEEWYAGVLASEFHHHLGVFAIIGVKMGMRAREYFGAGLDEMTIVSHAGTHPPVSCMNDGLQASTGATLGHGLITVARDSFPVPAAEFTCLGNTIRIELKPEIKTAIASAVRHLKETYGLSSDEYWDHLRDLTIEKWSTLDRHRIFTITTPEKQ